MQFENLFEHVPLIDGMFTVINRITKETRLYGTGTGTTREMVDEWIRNYRIPVISTIRIGSIPDECHLAITEFRVEDICKLPIESHLNGETFESALEIVYGKHVPRGVGFADLTFGSAALVVTYSGSPVNFDDRELPPGGRVRCRLVRVLNPV